ncbi:MAG: hypothetical protein QW755_05705 [Nitrososphaerota archaeon]
MTEPIKIKKSSIDRKIILALYHYGELRFTELKNITGARSKSNLINRLKILIGEGLIEKIDEFYCLTELGEKIAKEILKEQEIDELKYFKRKLFILTRLINCFSFPLNIKIEYRILNHYISLLYIKALPKKISENSKKSIKNIENIWKIIEKPEDIQLNVPFSWKFSIKEVLKEIEKDIKEKEEKKEKEFLILFKKQLENENINLKLFNELHEYSKNPTLWYLNNFLEILKIKEIFIKMILAIIGAIIGTIPSLMIFSINRFLIFPLLFMIISLLMIRLPYEYIENVTILLSFAQDIMQSPLTIRVYIIVGMMLGVLYAILYKKIPGKNSKIKGMILISFSYLSIVILPYLLLLILTLYHNIKGDIIQCLLSFIVGPSYVLICALLHGYILGFLWDRIIKLIVYLKQKYSILKLRKE